MAGTDALIGQIVSSDASVYRVLEADSSLGSINPSHSIPTALFLMENPRTNQVPRWASACHSEGKEVEKRK